MDVSLRVAAWATQYYNPDLVDKVIEGVSWVGTYSPLIELACHYLEIEIPEWGEAALHGAEDVAQLNDEVEEAERIRDGLTDPDRGVEIGGWQVEAEIAEIRELQEKQEIERADLARDIENSRNILTEQYIDSPDEMQQQLKRFEDTAIEMQEDLAAQQAAELQKLQEWQQLEQQQLEMQQLEQLLLEQQQLEQQLEQQQLEQQQLEQQLQQQLEQQQLEQQQLEQQLEQQLLEQQLEQQRLEQLRLEQELERLRLEQERLEQLRLEQLRLAQLSLEL